jgi:hypothetical protein
MEFLWKTFFTNNSKLQHFFRNNSTPYSFGLSATSQQYFSLRTNQPPAISQQYFSLRTNQHQPSATSQANRLQNCNFTMNYYYYTAM